MAAATLMLPDVVPVLTTAEELLACLREDPTDRFVVPVKHVGYLAVVYSHRDIVRRADEPAVADPWRYQGCPCVAHIPFDTYDAPLDTTEIEQMFSAANDGDTSGELRGGPYCSIYVHRAHPAADCARLIFSDVTKIA